jgi:mitogen-activated protein kinase kinase kinase
MRQREHAINNGFTSVLTNKLMVRVTNYFDSQVRVPLINSFSHKSQRLAAHTNGINAVTRKKMSDEQLINWYAKILESGRLRHRKLQRFARYDSPCIPSEWLASHNL